MVLAEPLEFDECIHLLNLTFSKKERKYQYSKSVGE